MQGVDDFICRLTRPIAHLALWYNVESKVMLLFLTFLPCTSTYIGWGSDYNTSFLESKKCEAGLQTTWYGCY